MKMWQQAVCVLSLVVSGSVSVSWDMTVSPVVFVPRGEDAVLGCSFTHPRQQDYSGPVTVKWLAREPDGPPFFICSVRNDSADSLQACLASELKYSLQEDPRRGELSLLIRRVHLGDNGTFFCRVELDGLTQYFQKETQLYVTVKPQILSLSVVEAGSGSDDAPSRLQCEAEGHPPPNVTWLSASGGPPGAQTVEGGPYGVVSSVLYLQGDVLTCRVQSRLGVAERRFPSHNTLVITSLSVCGGVILLLLLLSAVFFYSRNSARADTSPADGVAAAEENDRLQDSDSAAEGDVELQPVYSAVSVSSRHVRRCRGQQEDTGDVVVYSPVNVQQ